MNRWLVRIIGVLVLAVLLMLLYNLQRTLQRMVAARTAVSVSRSTLSEDSCVLRGRFTVARQIQS